MGRGYHACVLSYTGQTCVDVESDAASAAAPVVAAAG